jgi:hypothetical protein
MSINMELKLNNRNNGACGGRLLPQQKYPYHILNSNNHILRKMFLPPQSPLSSNNHAMVGNGEGEVVAAEPVPASSSHDTLLCLAYAARLSCVVALLPMVLFANNEKITKSAACLHLLMTPVTSFFLQNFSYARCHERRAKIISCFLSGVCFALGNSAAVILLANDDPKLLIGWVNGLLSVALCLGSGQLLMVLHKGNVVRVMACTAAAVMVVVLAILGSVAPLNMTKRFFQSAAIPFLLLFLETSRLSKITIDPVPPQQAQITA